MKIMIFKNGGEVVMKKVYISLFLLFSVYFSVAQQNLSLYYQTWLPQSTELNPAIQNNCKLYFGGLLLPLAGQLVPNVHFNYSNNYLSYKDVVRLENGVPTIDNSTIENAISKVKHVNYLAVESELPFLYGGYRFNDKLYLTLGIADKVDFKYSMPRDLLILAWEGNGKSLLGKTIDFTGLGVDASYYREFKIGASYKINDKLTLGISPKLLFGKANINTQKSTITWETKSDDYTYIFHTDWEVNISQPVYTIEQMDYDYEGDSLIYKDTINEKISPKQVIFNNKNFGLGVDLGAIYKVNDKVNVYASIIDLGYIKWKDNPQTLKVQGDFVYDGYDVRPFLEQNDSLNQANADNYRDSVIHIFEPSLQKDKYVTYLTPKFYIGGTYQWKEYLGFGMLARFEMYKYILHPSLTLSANSRLTKWFGATLSYTMMNNSYTNIGLAFIFKLGPVQWFLASDNFWGFIWPQSARNVNLRMGINLKFGCKKYEGATLIH